MYPVLLGINAMGYGSFTECDLPTLSELVNLVDRGVVENKRPQYPESSWWSILAMEPQTSPRMEDPSSSLLVRLTKAALINIPVTNPTYGLYSISLDEGIGYVEEVDKVTELVIERSQGSPVIASITAPDRFLHRNYSIKCSIYLEVDKAINRLLSSGVDSFIIFSPYGEPIGESEGEHEDYGIYLATISRPRPHDTIKVYEIGALFRDLVLGSYSA